jgi:hypothetical protein
MITDALLLIDSSNATILAAATYVSNNTLDLSLARDIGAGEGMKCLFNVEVAFAGGTSVQFQQILSAAANLGAPTVIDNGIVVPLANLVAGAMIVRPVPELLGGPATIGNGLSGLGSKGLRYYGTQYVSLGIFTLGTVSARLVKDLADVKFYPSGYAIL